MSRPCVFWARNVPRDCGAACEVAIEVVNDRVERPPFHLPPNGGVFPWSDECRRCEAISGDAFAMDGRKWRRNSAILHVIRTRQRIRDVSRGVFVMVSHVAEPARCAFEAVGKRRYQSASRCCCDEFHGEGRADFARKIIRRGRRREKWAIHESSPRAFAILEGA